jgi:predicted transcriptional regulator
VRVRPAYYYEYDQNSYQLGAAVAVEKLSVSLPGPLASRIDELAEQDGISRSALIQEAAAQYVASRDAAVREARRRTAVDDALTSFDEIAASWGDDDCSGVEYLADVRGDTDGVSPADDAADPRG